MRQQLQQLQCHLVGDQLPSVLPKVLRVRRAGDAWSYDSAPTTVQNPTCLRERPFKPDTAIPGRPKRVGPRASLQNYERMEDVEIAEEGDQEAVTRSRRILWSSPPVSPPGSAVTTVSWLE